MSDSESKRRHPLTRLHGYTSEFFTSRLLAEELLLEQGHSLVQRKLHLQGWEGCACVRGGRRSSFGEAVRSPSSDQKRCERTWSRSRPSHESLRPETPFDPSSAGVSVALDSGSSPEGTFLRLWDFL